MKSIRVCLLFFFLMQSADADDSAVPYVAAKGGAWRLAAANVDHDREHEIIYSALDGAIRCVDPASGALLWEVPLGGFAWQLRAADIDLDGKPEFFAPCADGMLYAISHRGEILWTFKSQSSLQMTDAIVAFPRRNNEGTVLCSGFDGMIYQLDEHGKLRSETSARWGCVRRLAVADLKGKSRTDTLLALDSRQILHAYQIKSSDLRFVYKRSLQSCVTNWENGNGSFHAFSVTCADLDGAEDDEEIILGETFWSPQMVMTLNGEGELLWRSEVLNDASPGYEYYSTAFVRAADLIPKRDGLEVLALAGRNFRLFGSDGELLDEFASQIGFTDLLIDETDLWLGSSPNGDETIYRIDLSGDWKAQIQALERIGKPKQIGENLARLRGQVLACEYAAPTNDPVYDLRIFNVISPETYRRSLPDCSEPGSLAATMEWFEAHFGHYPNLKATGLIDLLEEGDIHGTDGRVFRKAHTHAQPMSADELVDLMRHYDKKNLPVIINFAHGGRAQLNLKTVEAMLQAAPNALTGFIGTESGTDADYYRTYFGPLMDLCAEYGNRKCVTHEKSPWWVSTPARQDMFNELFEGNRPGVFCAGVEDSSARNADLNLMGRMGLRQAGLIREFQPAAVKDLFTPVRVNEWEYPVHGHPFFRLLAVQTLLGGESLHMRIDHLDADGFTLLGNESTEIIFHMLGKGLLLAPRPGQMAGLSSLGIVMHEPPANWLKEIHNNHSPERWLEFDGIEELNEAVIPHGGATWGNTRTPLHALGRILFCRQEQAGHIPATPYGAVAIVPEHADLEKVVGVRQWLHTDGMALWEDGGRKKTGVEAADLLRTSFEKAAADLPFRPFGDDVFFHTVRMNDNTYRIYAIDPGWLTPAARNVQMKIQLDGNFAISDLLSEETLNANQRQVDFTVPAGCLRILEATRQNP